MNTNIEQQVIEFQRTNCDITFSEIYNYVSHDWKKKIRTLSQRYSLDEQDVEEMLNYRLLKAAQSFDPSKGRFFNLLNRSFKLGCISLVRKRALNKELLVTNERDEEGNEIDFFENKAIANADVDELIESVQKNYEQRQLFATLTELADYKTRQCLSALSVEGSYQAAAKQLGTTRKTVRRRITALSLKYDANRFGDIHDYFTAPTVKIAN